MSNRKFLTLIGLEAKRKNKMTYKYYLHGNTTPIRAKFNQQGQIDSAEVPDLNTQDLVNSIKFFGLLHNSMEVDEITEDQFNQEVRAFLENRLTPTSP